MTTTWRQVARKDFADAVRSKMVWGTTGIFVFFMGLLLAIAPATFPVEGEIDAEMALAFVAETVQLFVPVVALIVAYMAIVGERRSGSLRILLSYPFSRFDVVAGKFVGRTLVIGTALSIALVVTLAVAAAIYGTPGAGTIIGMIVAVLLFGLAFTGLGVGVSAATSTRGKAMAGVLGVYLVCLMFWEAIVAGIYYVVTGSLPGLEVEAWYFLLLRLNPIEAFRVLVDGVLEPATNRAFAIPVEDIPQDATPEQLELANRVIGELPFYLSDWTLIVILLAWGLLPIVIGYWQFARTDLN